MYSVLPLKKKSPASTTVPCGRRDDRRAFRSGDVHAGMRIARLPVEVAARAVGVRPHALDRCAPVERSAVRRVVNIDSAASERSRSSVDALQILGIGLDLALVLDRQVLRPIALVDDLERNLLRRHARVVTSHFACAGFRRQRNADTRPSDRRAVRLQRVDRRRSRPAASSPPGISTQATPPGTRRSFGSSSACTGEARTTVSDSSDSRIIRRRNLMSLGPESHPARRVRSTRTCATPRASRAWSTSPVCTAAASVTT